MRLRNAFLERCGARLAVSATRALFSTVRRRLFLAAPELSPYRSPEARTCIYSVWHDSLLMPMFLGKQPATKALVGQHADGAFLATALDAIGIGSVRGSSSRGGAEALRQLIDQTTGFHIVVTPDGPRGPRREMKTGVTYLASKTGKVVVPTAFACSRYWSWGTGWTDLVVPKPGCTVVAIAGQGIAVPSDANREELHEFTQQIQSEMDELNAMAVSIAESGARHQKIPAALEGFSQS